MNNVKAIGYCGTFFEKNGYEDLLNVNKIFNKNFINQIILN